MAIVKPHQGQRKVETGVGLLMAGLSPNVSLGGVGFPLCHVDMSALFKH